MRENKQKGKDQLKLLSVQNTTPTPHSPANRNLHVSSFTLLKPKSVFFFYITAY